ncbi:MAG: TonB-dependent receptor [Bacteroidales bacterium]
MKREILTTSRKALRINLDTNIYGTFAEIGGGQEVARNFFQAGGASGTVAKTISAYDKRFSDHLYNQDQPGRYVSEKRLEKMLDTEYRELTSLLGPTTGDRVKFFVFANTVATLNFRKDNEAHGWLGIRYQLNPGEEPNDIILHVKLLENDTLLQQNTLGILGVNLIYGATYLYRHPNEFLQSLMDNLSRDRIEVTMVRMKGPQLDYVDNRLLAVQLVNNKMAQAIMFDRHGEVQEPADMLYRKNVLAFRGSFRPITYVGFDMLRKSYAIFKRDEDYAKERTMALCEITMDNLLEKGELDPHDFLDRVDLLNGMGQNVMVSSIREYHKLVNYFSTFKIKNLRIVMGVPNFLQVLNKSYYTNLRGGILEALGQLFTDNMKLYIYPTIASVAIDDPTLGDQLLTSDNLPLPDDIRDLYDYLRKNRKIIVIENAKREWLYINSRYVLKMIQKGEEGWEKMVPRYVEDVIKQKGLFGYRKKESTDGKTE